MQVHKKILYGHWNHVCFVEGFVVSQNHLFGWKTQCKRKIVLVGETPKWLWVNRLKTHSDNDKGNKFSKVIVIRGTSTKDRIFKVLVNGYITRL